MDIPHVTDPHTVATRLTVTSPEQMRDLGRRLAKLLRPGDLVLLTGELGAGKTTLTRGLGEGLGVRGAVTSPTFVIARVHPSLGDGPPLVHVDAYRLGGGLDEMEDLDLDVSLPDSVVAVEWGEGKVEGLAEDRLHVVIERTVGEQAAGAQAAGGRTDGEQTAGEQTAGEQTAGEQTAGEQAAAPEEDVRRVVVTGVGPRWAGEDLAALAG